MAILLEGTCLFYVLNVSRSAKIYRNVNFFLKNTLIILYYYYYYGNFD